MLCRRCECGGRHWHAEPRAFSCSSSQSVAGSSLSNMNSKKKDLSTAARKLAGVMNSLKEELECSICHHMMTDVRRVTCGHWFDLNCIEQAIKNRPPGQRSGSCPDCGHGINKRSLKEDDVMQVLVDKVREGHTLVKEYGLESEGRQVDDSSASSASSTASGSSSSTSSQEAPSKKEIQTRSKAKAVSVVKVPPVPKGGKKGGRKPKNDVPAQQPVQVLDKAVEAVREPEATEAAETETAVESLSTAPVVNSPLRDENEDFTLCFEYLVDPNLTGTPPTPDASFGGLAEHCLQESGLHNETLPFPYDHSFASMPGCAASGQAVSSADQPPIHSMRKRLFEPKSDLSESSSEASGGAEGSGAPNVDTFRSAISSPVTRGSQKSLSDVKLSDLSKASSHTSQFFENWPYQKSQESAEKQDDAERHLESSRAAKSPATLVPDRNSIRSLSPMPSFLAISPRTSQSPFAHPKARVSTSQATQTSPLHVCSQNESDRRRSSQMNEISRRRSCSSDHLQDFMRQVVAPTLREVISDVLNKQ